MVPASVTVHIPSMLRSYAAGAAAIEVPAGTVRDVFSTFQRSHPALERALRTETGALRPHVNVFVNRENVRQHQGLDTPLDSGDVVYILPSITGG